MLSNFIVLFLIFYYSWKYKISNILKKKIKHYEYSILKKHYHQNEKLVQEVLQREARVKTLLMEESHLRESLKQYNSQFKLLIEGKNQTESLDQEKYITFLKNKKKLEQIIDYLNQNI